MSEILLINPKYDHNLGGAVRAAATLNASAVWWTGNRVDLVGKKGKERIPREERLREYSHIKWGQVNDLKVFDEARLRHLTPVCVEITPGAESLTYFEHPENALYVFGPEDGSLGPAHMRHCHKFVQIPSKGCVNLAAAVYIILYDRLNKEILKEARVDRDMGGLDCILTELEDILGPVDQEMLKEARKLFN